MRGVTNHVLNMQIQIDAKRLALGGYIILSLLYIAYTLFAGFRDGMLRNAYDTGRTDTVKALIEKATDGKCETLNVYAGDKKVDLVNVECLQKVSNSSETASPMPVPPVSGN